MPELPDLEVMSRNLHKRLAGKRLESLKVNAKQLNVPEKELSQALVRHELKKIYREGKQLRLAFTGGHLLGLHLMLHGELAILEESVQVKFAVIRLKFSKDLVLVLSDFQQLATPTLDPEEATVPDALDPAVNADFLADLLSKKKSALKNILLDQKVIRGIGNAYADEICYDAKISPFSIANKIPTDAVEKLVKSMHKVLTDAVEKILNADPERITGENRDFMKVHLPKKDKTSKGEEILVKKNGARKTYYVKEQVNYA